MPRINEVERAARLQAIDEARETLIEQLAAADPVSTRATAILEAMVDVERLRWSTDPHGTMSPGDRVAPDIAFFRRKRVAANVETVAAEAAAEQGFTWNSLDEAERELWRARVRDRTWGAEHRRSFTVSGVFELQTLALVKSALDRALVDGTPYSEFKRTISPRLRRAGFAPGGSHERLVFRQNRRQAAAAGQWERAQRSKRDIPNFTYHMGSADEHRPHAFAWDGLTAPIDSPVWASRMPPNGFNCTCHVTQTSDPATDGYEELFDSEDPDPGFSYNPGDPWSVP